MPSIYSKNVSTQEAQERSNNGLYRRQHFRTNNTSHPSLGGSQGYPLWFRRDVIYWDNIYGIDYVCARFGVSEPSVRRWRIEIRPKQQTGNQEKEILTGMDQFLLVSSLFIYPRANADEIAMFIGVNGGTVGLSRADIAKRQKEMKITRKRASVEAFAAYTPVNRQRVINFFDLPPPIGISGVPYFRIIDFDEAKFKLEACESRYGHAMTCIRVRDTAHYKRMSKGVNLILAIEPGNPNLPDHIYGSIQNPRRWWIITTENVNQVVFADFVDSVCSDIETNPLPGGYDSEKYFMWDNLSAHQTGLLNATVEMRPTRPNQQFTIIPRPPYQPKYAPVEYAFCEIAMRLQHLVRPNWRVMDLHLAIRNIVITIGRDCKFNRTFRHCLQNEPR